MRRERAAENSSSWRARSEEAALSDGSRDTGFRSPPGAGSPRMPDVHIVCTSGQSAHRDADGNAAGPEGETRSQSRLRDGSGPRGELSGRNRLADVKSLHEVASQSDETLDVHRVRHRFGDDCRIETVGELDQAA